MWQPLSINGRRGRRVGASAICGAGLVALLSSCWDPDGAVQPRLLPSLRVTAVTTGQDLDTNGYLVAIDNVQPQRRLAPDGSLTYTGLSAGSHTLFVTDVAPNCVLEDRPITILVPSAQSAVDTDIRITCSALGALRIVVATAGVDVDRMYHVTATNTTSGATGTIPADSGAVVLRLAAGQYQASLEEVAANCDGPDLAPRSVDAVSGDTVTVEFTVACTAAGRLAYSEFVAPANAEIYTVRSDGRDVRRLTDQEGIDADPAWSPDGSRLAFTSERDGQRAVHVMTEDGTSQTRLTPHTSNNYRPAWSPDGSRIAFVSDRDGNAEVYVMNADGTDARRLTSRDSTDTDPAWSPDGARIAFSSTRDGNAEIYTMNADGSNVLRMTTSSTWNRHPAWSPDGQRLAFARLRCADVGWPDSCYPAVMVQGPRGEVEIGIGEEPAWSPDGRLIATTRFQCQYSYYYYYDAVSCGLVGVGILVPFPSGAAGARRAWDPVLTLGNHRHPTWRP